jgi:hypothetical protein
MRFTAGIFLLQRDLKLLSAPIASKFGYAEFATPHQVASVISLTPADVASLAVFKRTISLAPKIRWNAPRQREAAEYRGRYKERSWLGISSPLPAALP